MWRQTLIALIIIDMQKALIRKKTYVYQEKDLISHINQLIRNEADQNNRVDFVQHCDDSFLKEETPD